MPRPKGAKDKRPRKIHPNSVKGLRKGLPGWKPGSTNRPFGPEGVIGWWEKLSPSQKGVMLVILHYEIHKLTPDEVLLHPALQQIGADVLNKLFGRGDIA